MSNNNICSITNNSTPIITTAIHAGHAVRKELNALFLLSDMERLYEEDPFTDYFAKASSTNVIGLKSRFEVYDPPI